MAVCLIESLSTSCTKETEFLTDTATLRFSVDTLKFDTVFTTMGSTVRSVKVYNPNNQPVKIDGVSLAHGSASRFRINVDGDTALVARDVEILAHDSIFIFARVNVNPNSATSPFLIEDSIVFSIGNARQYLPLTAYGRNAVYHYPDHVIHDAAGNSYHYSVIDCSQPWTKNIPHVVFGYAVVDEGFTLNIEHGAEVYFGNDAVLWVYDGGTLNINGTADEPVLLTSIRHDGHYADLPGQWGYVWLSSGSRDNTVNHAAVRNGYIGFLADTVANANPTLSIRNTVIENMSLAGIYGQGARIEGDNLLVTNCQTATLALTLGGRYVFSNSTFANYWNYSVRRSPQLILNNWYESADGALQLRPLQQADFYNCIVYGSLKEELMFDFAENGTASFSFSNCLLKTETSIPQSLLLDCLINQDPKFSDRTSSDYHLQSDSPARGRGNAAYLRQQTDLDNRVRSNPPSIGAFEYFENSEVGSWNSEVGIRKLELGGRNGRVSRSSQYGLCISGYGLYNRLQGVHFNKTNK